MPHSANIAEQLAITTSPVIASLWKLIAIFVFSFDRTRQEMPLVRDVQLGHRSYTHYVRLNFMVGCFP